MARSNSIETTKVKRLLGTLYRIMDRSVQGLRLDEAEASRILSHPEDLEDLTKTVKQKLKKLSVDPEEADSDWMYPKKYRVKPLVRQRRKLQAVFPELRGSEELVEKQKVIQGSEGWFALPSSWKKVAGTYALACTRALDALQEEMSGKIPEEGQFYNLFDSEELDLENLEREKRTEDMLKHIRRSQKGDILIFPAQLGFEYRGCSVQKACERLAENEFGLGIFEVACLILTHPECLVDSRDIRSFHPPTILCPGERLRDPNKFSKELSVGSFASSDGDFWGLAAERCEINRGLRNYFVATGFVP